MFVELIESLRCPREHEESALIAAARRTESRHIVEGVLGCPVCGEEFAIVDGELSIDADAGRGAPDAPSPEMAMRIAALLELTDTRSPALLLGHWAAHADQIMRVTETPLVLVNAPGNRPADVAAAIVSRDAVPMAPGSVRGVALDPAMSDALRASALRLVRGGGRVLGDAPLPVPPGVKELVRDDRVWVGEKEAAPNESAPRLVRLERNR